MVSKFFTPALAACAGLVAMPVYATQPTDGLERYDYSELTLLRVIPGGLTPRHVLELPMDTYGYICRKTSGIDADTWIMYLRIESVSNRL